MAGAFDGGEDVLELLVGQLDGEFSCVAERARRSREFPGTVITWLVLAAELGCGLAAGGVFGHELLDLAVQSRGFELVVGLVEHVVVLLGESVKWLVVSG